MWPQVGIPIVLGIVFVALGAVLVFAGKIPWMGRLPGDFHYKGKNWSFHFPLATCAIASIILALIFWVLSRLWK